MSEREIRDAVQQACKKLELKARANARRRGGLLVFPLMVGAGLLVATCDDDDDTVPVNEPPYGVGTTTNTGTGAGTTSGTGTLTGGGGVGGGGGEGATGGFGAAGAGGADGGAGGG